MAATIEIKYFNSFLLKKSVAQTTNESNVSVFTPAWNGSTGVPSGVTGSYPVISNQIQSGTFTPAPPPSCMAQRAPSSV